MSFLKTAIDAAQTDLHTVMLLKLETGHLLISALEELPDENKILLLTPMIVKLGFTNGKETLTLSHYIPKNMVTSTNFMIDSRRVISVHLPDMKIVDFYMKKSTETTEKPTATTSKSSKSIKENIDEMSANANNIVSFSSYKEKQSNDEDFDGIDIPPVPTDIA